jgi:hypothetical protein
MMPCALVMLCVWRCEFLEAWLRPPMCHPQNRAPTEKAGTRQEFPPRRIGTTVGRVFLAGCSPAAPASASSTAKL